MHSFCEMLLAQVWMGFPGGTNDKGPACHAGDLRKQELDPRVGKVPWGRHGQPPQASCLENPTDRGACRATVHGVSRARRSWSDSAAGDVWLMLRNATLLLSWYFPSCGTGTSMLVWVFFSEKHLVGMPSPEGSWSATDTCWMKEWVFSPAKQSD